MSTLPTQGHATNVSPAVIGTRSEVKQNRLEESRRFERVIRGRFPHGALPFLQGRIGSGARRSASARGAAMKQRVVL
ncbi:hypothetical protein CesoFtcFv8_021353 [Champsocephalus esox]|uniref:Uncharacterized protein n=1 Tax=Champsocephalus esox TaxID=159716 RepID=A0AAN8BD81_9TELE|nr:hypothetical protein CesoFtcFv8_021353 [Champsocephalus esox]